MCVNERRKCKRKEAEKTAEWDAFVLRHITDSGDKKADKQTLNYAWALPMYGFNLNGNTQR